jgi:crotonobetainyl-CoA:carnitine CoA-transferase CaiB-like acyl-CoA transferase
MGALLLYHFYGEIRQQIGNRGFHSYNTCLQARDGWVVLSVVTNSIWRRFVEKIGHPEMANDSRFGNDMDRFRNSAAIDDVVRGWVADRTVEGVVRVCEEARVPCGPLQSVDRLLTDRQALARDMVQQIDYGALGSLPVPGTPIKMSGTPGTIRTPSPQLGQHNAEVYSGLLGIAAEEMSLLRQNGII